MSGEWQVTRVWASTSLPHAIHVEGINHHSKGELFMWTLEHYSFPRGEIPDTYDFTSCVWHEGAKARFDHVLEYARSLARSELASPSHQPRPARTLAMGRAFGGMSTYSADSDASILPREILVECGFSTEECGALEEHLRVQTGGEYAQDIHNAYEAAEGLYWWASEWHSGQTSRGYQVLCTVTGKLIGFRPAPSANGIDDDSHTARLVYEWLEQNVEG